MADHRHKRETAARRRPRAVAIAVPLAVLATTAAVGAGVLAGDPQTREMITVQGASADLAARPSSRDEFAINRSATRPTPTARPTPTTTPTPVPTATPRPVPRKPGPLSQEVTERAVRNADTRLWTTTDLNLWTRPDDAAQQVGLLASGERVLVTGREMSGREEIVLDGRSRWVTAGYLSEEKPVARGGECTNGTSVPSGVSPNVKKVHAAVCAAFPEISTYGTFRSDGEHSQGIAVDIMVSGERGWEVATFLRENYADLGISYLIYSQQIWSVERSGEGWRGMSDRGSATANHYDHVHVTTY